MKKPYEPLLSLIRRLDYHPDWVFEIRRIVFGLSETPVPVLFVTPVGVNTYHPEQTDYTITHQFPVPPMNWDEHSWQRWLLERLMDIAKHEVWENFKIDGKRPYAPHHALGGDHYMLCEHGQEVDNVS